MRRWLWVVALLAVLGGVLVLRTYTLTEGVLATRLALGCEIWHFTPESWQPERTVVLACPGRELMRLYPLPIVSEWSDDQAPALPVRRG